MKRKRNKIEYKVRLKFIFFPKTMYPVVKLDNGRFSVTTFDYDSKPVTIWLEHAFIVYERHPGSLNFWQKMGWYFPLGS